MSELVSNCAMRPVQFVAECATDGMRAAEVMRAAAKLSSIGFPDFINSSRCRGSLFNPRVHCAPCLKDIRNAAASIRQMILHAVVREIGQSIGGVPGERRYMTAYSHLSINERLARCQKRLSIKADQATAAFARPSSLRFLIARSRNLKRWIFPVIVLGSSGIK